MHMPLPNTNMDGGNKRPPTGGKNTPRQGADRLPNLNDGIVLVAARSPDLKRKLSPPSQQVLAVREAALKQLSHPMMMSTSYALHLMWQGHQRKAI